jgi:flagellar basal-body rod protein FlgB
MLEEIDLMRLTGDRMRYLTQQQTLIARNIANADTPGYLAEVSAPFSFKSVLLRTGDPAGSAAPLKLAATQAGHIAMPQGGGSASRVRPSASSDEKPDGNTVSLEEQMVKSTDVQNNFALATAAYTKSVGLLKLGIDFGK